MNAPFENDWQPDPLLLAAYFDGELEGRDEMADMRARIEAWLEMNPKAAAEWAKHHHLQELWEETTPAEPSAAAWSRTLEKIDAERRRPKQAPTKRPWFAAGLFVASVALFIGLLVGALRFAPREHLSNFPVAILPSDKLPAIEDVEVFAVAVDSEVTILRIEGVDMASLVVGEMPLDGPMELAERGEVRVIRCCPQTIQVRQTGRPMVSPKVDAE